MSEKAKETKASVEPKSVYSADELAQAAELFATTPDIVRTALRVAGVTEATVSAAKDLVSKFRKKEVQ